MSDRAAPPSSDNASHVWSGWCAWAEPWADASRPLTDALVSAADVRPGQRVLDVASGTGEPAFTLARLVEPDGEVVATDVAEALLGYIDEQARLLGLARLVTRPADALALPFPDGSFDRVICRLGSVPDWPGALREMRRVLKPDGRVVLLHWGSPSESQIFTIMRDALVPHLPAAQGSTGPSTFAESGSMAALLEGAGFLDSSEERLRLTIAWPGPPEQAAVALREMSPTMATAWAQLTAHQREVVGQEIVDRLRALYNGRSVALSAVVAIGTGTR
jgi:SAM-dependent methyltransferase